jgi:hypothetical protein
MSKETMFDRRIAARNIGLGRISRKEFEQHLASLPDVSGKSVPLFSSTQSGLGRDAADLDDDEDELDEDV